MTSRGLGSITWNSPSSGRRSRVLCQTWLSNYVDSVPYYMAMQYQTRMRKLHEMIATSVTYCESARSVPDDLEFTEY